MKIFFNKKDGMDKSRLIEVLSTFDKKEVRDCRKFLQSPFFNQRDDVIALYNYLVPLIPFKQKAAIRKEKVYRELFKNEAFDEKKMYYTISFLYNNIKTFLSYKEFEENKIDHQIYLSRSLRKRGLQRHFESELKQAQKLLDEQPFRSTDFHLHNFQIQFEICDNKAKLQLESGEDLQKLSDSLNAYFIARKLNLSCTALSEETFSKVNFQKDLLPEVLNYIEAQDFSNAPAIAVYFNSYKMLSEPASEPYFYQLKSFINQEHHRFPIRELKDIYLFTINYCIKQQNQGKRQFLKEAFDLYQKGLEQEVFIENGKLSRRTYNNIAIAGLILTEFDWVEDFLHTFKDRIEEKQKGMSYVYNLAYLFYKKNDYSRAMELLQQAEFEDMLVNLQARRILLKIYFELEEFDALDSLLSSFKNYIYRQDLGYHRNNYLNLIKYTKKLLQLNRFNKNEVEGLYKEVEASSPLAEKKWLLEQVRGG